MKIWLSQWLSYLHFCFYGMQLKSCQSRRWSTPNNSILLTTNHTVPATQWLLSTTTRPTVAKPRMMTTIGARDAMRLKPQTEVFFSFYFYHCINDCLQIDYEWSMTRRWLYSLHREIFYLFWHCDTFPILKVSFFFCFIWRLTCMKKPKGYVV